MSGGAFDGTVYLTFTGENGTTDEMKLDSDRYSFDSGEVSHTDFIRMKGATCLHVRLGVFVMAGMGKCQCLQTCDIL